MGIFTPAHRRAIEWLRSDGSWATCPGHLSAAVASLHLFHRELVDGEWWDSGLAEAENGGGGLRLLACLSRVKGCPMAIESSVERSVGSYQ